MLAPEITRVVVGLSAMVKAELQQAAGTTFVTGAGKNCARQVEVSAAPLQAVIALVLSLLLRELHHPHKTQFTTT